jgi:hypothetical protein
MKSCQKYFSVCLLALFASAAFGQAPDMGNALDFAVLGGSNVTCTAGVVTGDIGVSPGVAPPYTNTGCTITGATPPATNAAAAHAQVDLADAYDDIRKGNCTPLTRTNTGTDPARDLSTLSGVTLAPGTYCIDDVAKTGVLTLNGPANGIWIFKVIQTAAGDLTGTNFTVSMTGGGQACNVFWAPATAATMTDSALKGNILAGSASDGSITLTRGSVAGSVLAAIAVTMTGASVIGCDTLEPDESPSCKPKKHHHKHKNHDDKKGHHDYDYKKGHDDDKNDGYGKSPWDRK